MTEQIAAPTKTLKPAYTPRPQFLPFHNRSQRWAVLVVHRRGGKTTADVNELIERGLYTKKPDAQFAYVAPQLKQAKKIAWSFLKKYAKHVTKKVNEAELYVELVNGSKIYIFGADDPDSARGLYLDGVVLDEVAQIKPSFWSEVIRPSLADRQGWAVFIGTPKGKGNLLYKVRETARNNPDKWFYLELKASETKLIGEKELAELKEDMDDAEYQQEFECSFDAALVGSYYGKQITQLIQRNKIVPQELYNHQYPVSLAMDIGRRDATAIWFWQIINGQVRFIEYFESVGQDAEEVCEMLQRKPYKYKEIYLPHDALHKTFSSKKSAFDTFVGYNMPVHKAPDPDSGARVFHGIDAVRKFLRTYPIVFNSLMCSQGIEALKNYSREWQSKLGQFSDQPKHDRWSHGADGFRYAALSIQWEDIQRSADEQEKTLTSQIYPNQNIRPSTINTRQTLNDSLRDYERKLAAQRTGRPPRI